MLCPKCHRPVMDARDDAGALCCAHASVQWRCTLCARIVPGFAFAYGSCPHCGGTLELLDTPRASEPAALAGIRMAFEIELGARAFYQRAAADSADAALKELFGRFAVMEGTHMETLARRYHVDVPAPSQAFSVELAAIFAGVENRPRDPENLFRIATAWERRAADYFAERAADAAAGSSEQTLYHELAAEEAEHAQWLTTAHARWLGGHGDLFPGDRLHAVPAAQAGTMNAAELLLEGHDAARTALVCGEQSLSYGALRERTARAAGALRKRGVAAGDRVAIKLPDGLDWVCAYLGAIWAGAVAVAVNPRIPAPEWQYILDEAGFGVIVAESADETPPPWRDRVLRIEEWRREVEWHGADRAGGDGARRAGILVPLVGHLGQAEGRRAPAALRAAHRAGLARRPGHRRRRPPVRQFQAVLLVPADQQPVCGPEARRHGIARSAVADGAKRGRQRASPAPERVVLRALAVPQPAARGPGARHRRCRRAAVRVGRRSAAGESARRLARADGADHRRRLRRLRSAGPGHARQRRRQGLHAVARRSRCRPLGDAPADAPTRLAFRAPTLALGYLDRPQAQSETFRDGLLFCPADLFRRNASGGWGFAGREDALVKIRGRWVNLVELEQQLAAQATGILEAAAVCVPDGDGVDAVALFFVARDAAVADAALRSCAERLPPYQRPRWLHPLSALPRTPTGKLLRRKLQELHRALA